MARGAGAGAARRLRGRLHMLINISLRHGRRRTAPPEAHPRETPSPWTAPLRMGKLQFPPGACGTCSLSCVPSRLR